MILYDIPPNQVLTKAGFEFLEKMANLILKNIHNLIKGSSEIYIKHNAKLPADTLAEYLTLFICYNLGTIYQADEGIIHGMLEALHDQIPLAKKLAIILGNPNQNAVTELKKLTIEEGMCIGQSVELLEFILSVTDDHDVPILSNQAINQKEILDKEVYETIEIYLNDTWQNLYKMYKNDLKGAYEILFAILSRVVLLTCLVLTESMDFLDLYVKDAKNYFLAISSNCAVPQEISIQ